MHTLMSRFGDDMQLRGLATRTQQSYRGAVVGLARHFTRAPDTLDTLSEAELPHAFPRISRLDSHRIWTTGGRNAGRYARGPI